MCSILHYTALTFPLYFIRRNVIFYISFKVTPNFPILMFHLMLKRIILPSLHIISILLIQISTGNAQIAVTALVNSDYANVPDNSNILLSGEYRKIIDLNGEWEIKTGSSKSWQKIKVPSSLDYTDKLLFRKNFMVPGNISSYHIELVALGINYNCTIKINGTYIGSHSGGYTSFSLNVLNGLLIPEQENTIEIEIDNSKDSDILDLSRSRPWGWKRYTGIIREIFLRINPKITLEDWKIDYQIDNEFRNSSSVLTFLFQNHNQPAELSGQSTSGDIAREDIQEIGYFIEIYNIDTGKLVKSTATAPKYFTIHQVLQDTLHLNFQDVALWTPENPVLYTMILTIIRPNHAVVDRFQSPFGFKSGVFQEDGFYLNGSKIPLSGMYRVEQHPDYGISLPWEQQKEDLMLIKNLGFNVIRSGPYPNHPYFYELCDRLGILVLEELPVNYVTAKSMSSKGFMDHSSKQLREMIRRDRHHPSIIGWGLGSNLDVTDARTAVFLYELSKTARALDSRPLYYSTEIVKNDRCRNLVDFALLELYDPGISDLDTIINLVASSGNRGPLYIGRIGFFVAPEADNGKYSGSTSPEQQAEYISDLFLRKDIESRVGGIIFWGISDWQDNAPVLTAGAWSENYVHFQGLLSEQREQRFAYQHLKSALLGRQIVPLQYETNNFEVQGRLIYIGFAIIIILLVALKQHRWFGQNFRRSLISPKIFFEDMLDRRNVHSWQTVVLGIGIASSFALGSASITFYYRESVYFDILLSQFFISNGIKGIVDYLIWHPVLNTVCTVMLMLGTILIIALLHNYSLKITGHRRRYGASFDILVWSAANMVFLLPFSMAFYSALQNPSAILTYVIIVSSFFVWSVFRLFLALRIAFQSKFLRAFANLVIILVFTSGVIVLYFQTQHQSFTFVQHYFKSVHSQLE